VKFQRKSKNPSKIDEQTLHADMTSGQILEALLNDPPTVHIELGNPEGGVWRTHRDCYEFLANACSPGTRTLETGLGISTALFLKLGAKHTCVTPFDSEVRRLRAYCRTHAIPTRQFQLILGTSERVLPTLKGELDLLFIDGGHAFPIPMIDWYYAGSRLRRGGLIVMDDVQLPAVQVLIQYLSSDPRWEMRQRTVKWIAFERLSEGPFRDEWNDQLFYKPPQSDIPPNNHANADFSN